MSPPPAAAGGAGASEGDGGGGGEGGGGGSYYQATIDAASAASAERYFVIDPHSEVSIHTQIRQEWIEHLEMYIQNIAIQSEFIKNALLRHQTEGLPFSVISSVFAGTPLNDEDIFRRLDQYLVVLDRKKK